MLGRFSLLIQYFNTENCVGVLCGLCKLIKFATADEQHDAASPHKYIEAQSAVINYNEKRTRKFIEEEEAESSSNDRQINSMTRLSCSQMPRQRCIRAQYVFSVK